MIEITRKLICKLTGTDATEDRYGSKPHGDTVMVLYMSLVIFAVIRLGLGFSGANDPNECVVRTYGDVIIAPFYFVGCQLGKERFNYRLN